MSAHFMYGLALDSIWGKKVDWTDGNVKGLLCTASYTPNQDTHQYRSDLTNEVAAGGGYSSGGIAIPGHTKSYTAGTNTLGLFATTITFTSLTISFRYLIFYYNTGTPSTSPLLSYFDTGATQSPSAQDVVFNPNAAGVYTFSVT